MSAVEELTQICATLPPEKVAEVIDFARFLETRVAGESARVEESAGDAAWERIIAEKVPRPKFVAFMDAAMAEEPSELLTPEAFDRHSKP